MIQESALYLGTVGCGINGGNDTHVELTVAWNECDTKLVQVSFSPLHLGNLLNPLCSCFLYTSLPLCSSAKYEV